MAGGDSGISSFFYLDNSYTLCGGKLDPFRAKIELK